MAYNNNYDFEELWADYKFDDVIEVSGSNLALTTNNNTFSNISLTTTTPSTGILFSGSTSWHSTISLSDQFTTIPKPSENDAGKILVVTENGEIGWENPTGLSIEQIAEHPALEAAFNDLVVAWNKFQMMKKLCK